MNLVYGPALQSDASVIFAQAKNLIDAYEDTTTINYDKVIAWVKRKIETQISSYTRVSLNGEVCAYYRLCDDGELDDFYVLPAFRGQGIGTKILNRCILDSSETLWLYVFSCNFRAVSFYERFGFEARKTLGATRLIMVRKG